VPAPSTLAVARVGARLRITAVEAIHAAELLREGVLPGAVVHVASRTPLGGPVIVKLGRVRLALSAEVADAVRVEPLA
jgi:Fe2+ transport system protein FeoA